MSVVFNQIIVCISIQSERMLQDKKVVFAYVSELFQFKSRLSFSSMWQQRHLIRVRLFNIDRKQAEELFRAAQNGDR